MALDEPARNFFPKILPSQIGELPDVRQAIMPAHFEIGSGPILPLRFPSGQNRLIEETEELVAIVIENPHRNSGSCHGGFAIQPVSCTEPCERKNFGDERRIFGFGKRGIKQGNPAVVPVQLFHSEPQGLHGPLVS
ncbi:hypothetical protein XI04_03280 [Bradyrhizobium sp. CCBAU 11430]|nr:hypothetical protein [Bradyrhizobium sp. CCBAU 11430]